MPKLFYRAKEKFLNLGAGWDKLAPDTEHAIEYAHTHINQEPERMIDIHHYSMEYYLAHFGESINMCYRQNKQNQIDLQVADMVAQHTTDTDLVLYRSDS